MSDEKEKIQWYLKPWVVIMLLFFVLGPFGLPLVYKSSKFNKASKIILTVLMALYTWYLVDITMKTISEITKTLPQLQAVLG